MLDLFDPMIASALLHLSDSTTPPEGKNVKAGYTALFLWLGMAVAIGLLAWSMVRHLRKTLQAKENGVYGEDREIVNGPVFPGDDQES